MEICVLGPAEVRSGSGPIDLGTRKQRALLAALALYAGRGVPVDSIIDLLWGDDPPPGVNGTLQAYVAGLRKALEPGRQRRAPAALLVTVAPGYALRVQPDELDATRFARLVTAQHQRLAPVSSLVPNGRSRLTGTDLADAVSVLDEALGLWRGEPYAELDDAPDARAERSRLAELQLIGVEDRALANTWLGQSATVAAELEGLTSAHPLRERLWGLRALALARSGRQADALEVLRVVREVLDDELGLEPGPELRALQTAVLRQDEALEWQPMEAPPESPAANIPEAGSSDQRLLSLSKHVSPSKHTQGWPMVGRDGQLSALVELLDTAAVAGPAFASLVGEPGIGKTRLASELTAVALSRGVTVLTGRCSQDDGAPPLWPWASVLGGLGLALPTPDADSESTQFEAWLWIVEALLAAGQEQSVLLVLDDLHWADPSSLRVLRLLADSRQASRLTVLSTWRAHPEPTGALADVAEMLARRHAVRIMLEGLDASQAAEVVQTVSQSEPSSAEADLLRERTDGNPFFLVEYARLAAERGDLSALLAEDTRPSAVRDVLLRRLGRLPDSTRTMLRAAAVIGRQFDLDTLSAASGSDEDAVLDDLEPAEAAGLIRDDGIDRFMFAHALVRDTVYDDLSASRRARLHLRVAEALANSMGRETELARHWFAAGPSHVDRAWRAAVEAAAQVRKVYAHDQAAELLNAALTAMARDETATALDRYDVVMQLIDAYRWTALWPEMVESVEAAVAIAEEIGDIELVSQAATSTTVGALWQSAPHGEVHDGIVAALRRCLDGLPAHDNPTRCRVMLTLAHELYYGATFAERVALVDEAMAMAGRLADAQLLLDANQVAFSALWTSGTCERRLVYAERAMELAQGLGLEQAYVVAATQRSVVEAELGRVPQMWSAVGVARTEAERLRIPYGLLVLDTLVLPWLAMAGRFDDCQELMERIGRLDAQMSLEQSGDATAGALITLRSWQGLGAETAPLLASLEGGPMPVTAVVISTLLRSGQHDEAARYYAEHPIDLTPDDWFSLLNWGLSAEVALAMGDRSLAADVYARLAPLAGHSCQAGSGNASGPVDAFLALAAATVGESGLAARHAERAEQLIVEWQIPLAAAWFRRQRDRFGF